MTDLLTKTNYQFKEGDIVIPSRFTDEEYPTIGWTNIMESMVGEHCTIINSRNRCHEGGLSIQKFDQFGFPFGYYWCWPDQKLTLIKSK